MNGFNFVINKDAGTVQKMGASAIEALITNSGIPVKHVYFLNAQELLKKIKTLDDDAPILIGGGDGTIKSCAQILLKNEKSFGILPLGTMNLLAKDLDIPVQIDQALAAYASGQKTFEMDVGQVNDEIFLCCVGLGTMPETSEFREKHRSDSHPFLIPRLTAYVLNRMDRMNRKKLSLRMDGKKENIKTSALVISNNQYGPQGQWNEENFKRISMQDGVLGVYSAAPYTFWDKMRLLFRLGLGDWKKDQSLQEWTCETLKIQSNETSELLSLDGETKDVQTPLHIKILPQSLNILVPKGSYP